jgi:hypothetical protein
MEVGYGSVHRSKLKTVKVEQVIPNADYESKGYDIGLVKLKRPSGIKPIEIAAPEVDATLHSANADAAPSYIVSGWGRLLDIGDIDLATQLHQVNPQAAQAMAEEINSPEQLRAADLVEVDVHDCATLIRASAMAVRPAPSTSSAISAPKARTSVPIPARATAVARWSPSSRASSCRSAS